MLHIFYQHKIRITLPLENIEANSGISGPFVLSAKATFFLSPTVTEGHFISRLRSELSLFTFWATFGLSSTSALSEIQNWFLD
jgi:hypothetical protein